jgi:hypothetical protein
VGVSGAPLLDEVNAEAVPFVDRRRTGIACHEFGSVAGRGRGHERIVRGSTRNAVLRQMSQEVPVGSHAEAEERLAKPCDQEVAHDVTRRPVRSG